MLACVSSLRGAGGSNFANPLASGPCVFTVAAPCTDPASVFLNHYVHVFVVTCLPDRVCGLPGNISGVGVCSCACGVLGHTCEHGVSGV